MRAMILSAGLGTRMYPVTQDKIPKPMVKIAGKPLLQYPIELFKKHGINEIAINLHRLPEKIKEYFGDGSDFGVKIHYSHEPEILGTGGGIKKVEDFLNSTFIIYNADNITDLDISKLVKYHKKKGGVATLCFIERDKQQLELGEDNQILKFLEHPTEQEIKNLKTRKKYTFAGIYILEPQVLKFLPENQFSDTGTDLFPTLLKKGYSLYAYILDNCYWREVGNPEQYEQVKKELEN